MRSVKFRAWDSRKNVMFENIQKANALRNNDDFNDYLSYDCFTVMQYTGLKDKNGKEIYESDIIKGKHLFGPAGYNEVTAQVYFNHERGGYQWDYWEEESLEIIGNIYENPELLDGI